MFDSSLACFLLKACYNSSIDTSIKTKLKTGYCGKLSFKMICCKADSLHFFLSANLGPALCNSCAMLMLSYLQAAPTCTLFCILCIQLYSKCSYNRFSKSHTFMPISCFMNGPQWQFQNILDVVKMTKLGGKVSHS